MAAAETPAADRINTVLQSLQSRKTEWIALPLSTKLNLLKAVRGRMLDNVESWGKAGAAVRATDNSPVGVVSDTLGSILMPAMYINRLIQSLESIIATGKPPQLPCRTLPNGQQAVTVFPITPSDKRSLLHQGVSAEVHLRPEEEAPRQGLGYGSGGFGHGGRVCAVLGAGNQGFLALKDVLWCLYERGEVVVLKPHPLLAQWQRFADHVLAPLAERGYAATLELTSVEDTRALVYSPLVDCLHMTGGTATHDAIVWGPTPEEQQRRKAANDPLLKVPITSELGCVTPCIVAGGSGWKASQLRSQALNLVEGCLNNNSCNCNSYKVLVLPGDWQHAEAFLGELRAALRAYPRPPPYYPGIHQRYEAFKSHYPNCEVIDSPVQPPSRELAGPSLPYLLNVIDGLPTDPSAEYAFTVEPFAPVLTVVRLPTVGVAAFLEAAVRFANGSLWGSLSATLVLHPDVELAFPQEVARAVQELRYGVVTINSWSGGAHVIGSAPWGAFGGDQDIRDVGSGIGFIGNPYMVEGLQKVVYRSPLEGQAVPKPLHVSPIPMPVAKALCGFAVGGWWGIGRALWSGR